MVVNNDYRKGATNKKQEEAKYKRGRGGEGVKNFSKKYTKNTTVNPIDLNLIIYKN